MATNILRRDPIWDFRLERFDAEGNRLAPMPVELRARKILGNINESDWVQVPGKWKRGHTRVVKRVRDLTTDTAVGAPRHVILWLLLLAVALAVAIAAVIVARHHGYSAQSWIPVLPGSGFAGLRKGMPFRRQAADAP
jgi:hypothetical protein